MKSKLSISLLTVTLSCGLVLIGNATANENISYKMSEDEIRVIHEGCKDIAIENDIQGEEQAAFMAECIAANTMATNEEYMEESGLVSEESELPNLEDETPLDSEETSSSEENS